MRFIYTLVFLFTICASCDISDERKLDRDKDAIEDFLSDNSLTAEITENDLYYIIHKEGGTIMPNEFNTVRIDYNGFTLDGVKFKSTYDEGFPREENMELLSVGMQEGIKFLGSGGSATFFIPSVNAVDSLETTLPEDEPIRIELELLDFN